MVCVSVCMCVSLCVGVGLGVCVLGTKSKGQEVPGMTLHTEHEEEKTVRQNNGKKQGRRKEKRKGEKSTMQTQCE